MWLLTMNSMRARPTPSLGRKLSENASSGIGEIEHHLGSGAGEVLEVRLLDLERQRAFIDEAGFALGAAHGDHLPVHERVRVLFDADDGGHAEFAADDGGVAGPAAAAGDDGGRLVHDRLPVGIGLVGDEDFARLEAVDHARGFESPGLGRWRSLLPTLCPVASTLPRWSR